MSLSDDIGLPGEPASAATSSVASVEAGAMPERRPRERSGPGEGLVLLLWALVVIAAVVYVLHRQETKDVNDPVKKAERGEVTGIGPLSLLGAQGFGGAMKAIGEKYPGGRVISMRVDPVRISAGVHTEAYDVRQVTVDTGLGVHESGTGETTEKGLALSRLDAAGPQRLVESVNRKTHTQPTDVDYVTLLIDRSSARDSRWQLFLKRGTPPDQRVYLSDLSGHHVKRNF